jgi:large subunit ribosomal protein L21
MYAVIETGGKQYRVEVGTELEVELLDVQPGSAITLDRVLLVADGETAAIGQPVVANATVSAEVLRQDRGDKVISFKYRPKARRRVKKGHRQDLTVIRISDIVLDGKSAAAAADQAADLRKTERQRVEEAARRQAEADAALAAQLAKASKEAKAAGATGPVKRAGAAKSTKAAASEPEQAAAPKRPSRARSAKPAEGPTPGAGAEAKPKRSRATKKDE